tara:strand:- start:91 stop:2007 length:1917 start_codon:yes stop_codon:yes gene_type:complete
MKVSFDHLLRHIKSNPSIEDVSNHLFQLGHENEIQDRIIDIEITPNRGDCLSILGILRELSVFYEINFPKVDYIEEIKPLKLNFKNESPEICKNISFLKIEIEDKISNYTDELSDYFNDLEINKNNFFTDVSNYISYETGQPTHCYDYSTIDTNNIIFKEIDYDAEFDSLLEKKFNLSGNNAVFLIGDEIINLAGVMGGRSTACTKETRSVLIECAYFNPESIIGKSVKYDLQSDAAYKFERGVDRYCHEEVLRKFLSTVSKHTKIKNVQIYRKEFDDKKEKNIIFDISKLNSILGTELEYEYTKDLLTKLGFIFIEKNLINIPSYRNDISSPNDLAEEIARCIGYNSIKPKSLEISKKDIAMGASKEINISNFLIDNGFFEVVNFPFTGNHSDGSITLDNPLDKNRNYLRTNMKESLIDVLLFNERRQKDSVKLFEISNIYSFEKELKYKKRLGVIASGRIGKDYINFSKKIDEKYFITLLSKFFNSDKFDIKNISRDGIKSKKKDKIIYFEIDIEDLPENILSYKPKTARPERFVKYKKISEQPYSIRDLSFSVSNIDDMSILERSINEYDDKILKEKFLFDYFKNDKTNEHKVGFRFIFQSQKVTIKEDEVDNVMNDIISLTTSIKSVKIPGLDL